MEHFLSFKVFLLDSIGEVGHLPQKISFDFRMFVRFIEAQPPLSFRLRHRFPALVSLRCFDTMNLSFFSQEQLNQLKFLVDSLKDIDTVLHQFTPASMTYL